MAVGEIQFGGGPIAGHTGLRTERLEVTSTSDRAIQITSYFHFFEVNRTLRFDRRKAYGMHLDVPPGMSVRFEPGATMTVQLVPFEGERRIIGFNRLVDGPLDEEGAFERAVERAKAAGFLDE